MNRYYDQNEQFRSNNRIFEGYFTESRKSVGGVQRRLDALLSILYAILVMLTSERAIRLGRVLGVVGSLVGMGVLFAAIEAGSVGLGVGLLLGSLLVGIEYLCLRRHRD